MYTRKVAKSLSLALAVAMTASISASFAESEAGLQAQSQSSTQNNAQAARETGSSGATQNNSQSANEQHSQASTHNNSNGNSEAVGGSLGANRPTPSNVSISSPNPARNVRNYSTSSRTTSSFVRRNPHTVTRIYAWKSPRKRGFSTAYMQRTVREAAVNR
jgi:hypothetical protein